MNATIPLDAMRGQNGWFNSIRNGIDSRVHIYKSLRLLPAWNKWTQVKWSGRASLTDATWLPRRLSARRWHVHVSYNVLAVHCAVAALVAGGCGGNRPNSTHHNQLTDWLTASKSNHFKRSISFDWLRVKLWIVYLFCSACGVTGEGGSLFYSLHLLPTSTSIENCSK